MQRQLTATLVAAALLVVSAAPIAAQQVAPDSRFLVRVSPIALVFTNFKLGAEVAVTPSIAAEATLNHNPSFWGSELSLSSGTVGARLYPSEMFGGFSIAAGAGLMRFAVTDDEETFPMLHVELAYSWLLGENRRFYLAPAFGASRLFASGTVEFEEDEDFDWSINIPIPSWRLSVGYRF